MNPSPYTPRRARSRGLARAGAIDRSRLASILLAIVVLLTTPAVAQETSQVDRSSEWIEARIAELQAEPSSATVDAALAAYERALAHRQTEARFRARARELEAIGISAPQREAELRRELDELRQTTADIDISTSTDAEAIERQLALARAEMLAADQTLQDLRTEIQQLRARPEVAQARLVEVRADVESLRARIDAGALSDDSRPDPEAVATRSRAAALAAEIELIEQELSTQPVRLSLLELRRDQAALQLDQARRRADRWQQVLTERRGIEAEQTLVDSGAARLRAVTDSELIDATLQDNAALASELAARSELTAQAAEAQRSAQTQLDSLRRRAESARQKLDLVGLSPALGSFLQAEQRDLPEAREFDQASEDREERIAAAGLRGLQLEEELETWRATEARVNELLASVRPDRVDQVREQIERVVRAREALLRQLIAANDDDLRILSELETTERQALQVIRAYQDFLSRNLLWLRNEPPLTPIKLLALPAELVAVFSSPGWLDGLRVLGTHALISPLKLFAALLVLVSAWKRQALLDQVRQTARSVGKPSADSITATLRAVALTLLLAVPWPLLAAVTGWLMIDGPAANQASAAYGNALLRVAPILYFLLAVRNLLLPGGVAEAHFLWLPDALVALRRELFLLGLTVLVPGFFLILSYRFAEPNQTFAFAQLIYLLPVFGLARFLYRLLRPGRSILERLKRRPSVTYSPRRGWAWLIVTLTIPGLMGVVALAGFMYSASILLDRTIQTLLFALALALVSELTARWLLIAKRRARLQQVLARRAAAREQEGAEPNSQATEGALALDAGEDLASLDTDSRKLINVVLSIVALLGVVAIWSPVFPALVNLTGVTLWEYAQEVSGEQVMQRVSLADLLLAVVLTALTVAAARSLPALIEIILRQRGSVPSGSRLAFATLARYSIVLIGLALVLSIVGINWSKLQWLVAALGVGIGFGLQEIVANFISGLIILIERPVRVGDVVTVGEDTGRVVRIQIRATTIRKWDQQELIVPNKEFITSRVVNWSLSDETTRIFFMVGVAYGSDVEAALKLIEEAAKEHPVVLEDPAPLVTFEAFGDNSLNLGLRCYVPSVGDRLETTTALHLAINRKFNEAGIVIAFPQRDVHLDTSSPLEVRLFGADAGATAGSSGTRDSGG